MAFGRAVLSLVSLIVLSTAFFPMPSLSASTGVTAGTTASPVPCSIVADVALLLDVHTSYVDEKYHSELQFAASLTSGLEVDPGHAAVGMVIFGSSDQVVFDLHEYPSNGDIEEAILGVNLTDAAVGVLRYGNSVNTGSGLFDADRMLRGQGSRDEAAKVIVLITDGASNFGPYAESESSRLRGQGDTILTVSVGSFSLRTITKYLATSAKHAFHVDTYDHLSDLLPAVTKALCQLSPPEPSTYTSSGLGSGSSTGTTTTAKTRATDSDTAVKRTKITTAKSVKTTAITSPPKTTTRSTKPTDVILALDVSDSSKGKGYYLPLFQFAERLVSDFAVDSGHVRVGLVVFGSGSRTILPLSKYTNSTSLNQAIRNVDFVGTAVKSVQNRLTNIGGALRRADNVLQTQGSRKDANKIVVLFTRARQTSGPSVEFVATKMLKNKGKILAIVSVGSSLLKSQMSSLAYSRDFAFHEKGINNLFHVLQPLKSKLCALDNGMCLAKS